MAGRRPGWGAVRRLPSGRWQARWLRPDNGQRESAPETFPTKAAAQRWLAGKRTDIDRGTALDDRAAAQPLSAWWPAYIRSVQAASKPATATNYDQAWRLRILPRFGAVSVRRIWSSDVDDWIADLQAEGVSASKIIESYGVLKRLLDRVVRDKVIPSNPCGGRQSRLPRRPVKDRPVLSPADVERLASAMKRDDDRLAVRLLAYGGLRIGELLALRRRAVDLEHGTLTIRESVRDAGGSLVAGPTKTYATRTIALPEFLVDELREHLGTRRPSELVFPNRAGDYRRYRLFRRDSWDPACIATGMSVTPHDLRSTCASLLVDAGASVKDVQQHLGHADITTTLTIYARVRPGRSVDLASRLDALVAEGRGPRSA